MAPADIPDLLESGFDSAARESREAKPFRIGLAVAWGAICGLALGWKPIAIWLAVLLSAEFLGWLTCREWPQDGSATPNQRRRFAAATALVTLLWLGPSMMMWLSGSTALHAAAVVQWLVTLMYIQHFGHKSRILVFTAAFPAMAAILLAAVFLTPYRGVGAGVLAGSVAMAVLSSAAANMQNLRNNATLRRATAELVHQREAAEAASAAKSSFLAMMSHELRTPMNGVLGMAHVLRRTDLTPLQAQYAETILRSGDGLMAVLNDILDVSKIEAGRMELLPEPTDVRELMDRSAELWRQAAREKGVGFVCEVAQDCQPWLMLDPNRVRQIVSNLLSNAIKFTDRGRVALRVRPLASGGLVLEVSDTGAGIPPEACERLFNPFTQADASVSRTHGGTGLGLSIIRRLAELMGGAVRLHSVVGEGSVFTVEIPAEAAEPPVRAAEAPIARELDELRVLIAEDNPVNQLVLQALLDGFGLNLTLVDDGAKALEALRHEAFDLVLMDVHMPTLDGTAAVAAIRAGEAGRPDIPVIALTADDMSGDRERLLAAGFDDHVAKPIQPAALMRALARAGREPDVTGELAA